MTARGRLQVLDGPAPEVARRLLGAEVRHGEVAVRITEVEAYAGAGADPGSHAHRGRTRRNQVMFGPPGHLYVYLIYGMHYCCNVVCGPDGTAAAVLIRAGEVVDGLTLARSRRPRSRDVDLARGPGRLCAALGIDLSLGGTSLVEGPARLTLDEPLAAARISTGPRVGLRLGAERPWRFWITGDPTVSRYVAAAPRPSRARRSADHDT